MEAKFLKDSLFAGMTNNAFKLGTVLTLGWFWSRITGCTVLYRGSSMEQIDFANILAVGGADACEVSPPSYVQHNSGSTYFYVVRRANNCGQQEYTLAAAVKISIDADGNLAPPQSNDIFGAGAQQVSGSKVQLIWYYCPVEQKTEPVCFKVYYDSRTGQIDYESPIAVICYAGRGFYSYRSDALDAGTYLFAIRAEGAGGVENGSLARIRVQLDAISPDGVDILSAEAL